MVVTFASAIFATAIPSLVRKYGVSREISLLGVSLYVLGFAFGPIIWAPVSELKGRYLPFVMSLAGFVVFSFATGASDSMAAILVFRFLGGFFGAGPLTLAGPCEFPVPLKDRSVLTGAVVIVLSTMVQANGDS